MSFLLNRRSKWIAGAGAAALVAAGAAGLTWIPSASATSSPGQGSAYAQGFQVTPHEGSLAVGAVFDEALAGHTGRIARAQSQSLDLGAVGTSMKGYNCNKPPTAGQYVPDPLQAETPGNGGKQESSAGPSPQANNADGSVEHVLADSHPYGEADTTLGGQIAAPGNLVTFSGVTTKAWSGLVNGVRAAAATADVSKVTIAGTVTLSGLHWEAAYPSGSGAAKPVNTFHVSGATVGGKQISVADVSKLAGVVNSALAPLGVQVVFPAGSSAQSVLAESPLTIEVVPSSTRDGVTDPVISGVAEPAIYPIASGAENGFSNTSPAPYNSLAPLETNQIGQQIAAALCQSDTPITVADVTIASFTAGGYFNVSVGGVNASSGDIKSNPYNLGAFTPYSLPGSTELLPGTAGTAGTPASPGSAAVPGSSSQGGATGAISSAAGSTGGSTSTPAGPSSTSPAATELVRTASGPLLGIGLGVLGLLGLLAALDGHLIRSGTRKSAFQD